MARRSDYDILRIQTSNTAIMWKESRGIMIKALAASDDEPEAAIF